MTLPIRISLLVISAVALGLGCDRKDEQAIRTYDAPKEAPAPPIAMDATADKVPSGAIHWTVPAGWKQVPGSNQVRFATFAVSADDPKAELTVVTLPAAAAEVLPNVQRWAGQLKLPAVSESDLAKYVKTTQISGEQASIVDMTGVAEPGNPPTRLLAAIVPHDGQAWFFTLKAPAPIAAAQQQNFEKFLHSIEFPVGSGAAMARQGNPAEPHSTSGSYELLKWNTPEGWVEQPGSNAMRVTSFRVGSEDQQAEVVIARIPEGQTGSLLDNINRWRGQVGLEPTTKDKPAGFENVQFAGQAGLMLSYTGPQNGSQPPRQLLVATTIAGGDDWFVKMLGPEPLVSKQVAAFKQFVATLQLAPE